MALAYVVLLVIAALGLALGWRMAPAPTQPATSEGLARMLQLAIGLTGLGALAALSVPWFTTLPDIACTPEHERTGHCVMGLHDHGLFGASAFMCMFGAAFALLLRKSVFDQPPRAGDESEREAGVGDVDTVKHTAKHAPAKHAPAKSEPAKSEPAKSEPAPAKPEPAPAKPEAKPEPEPEPEPTPIAHRRLEGPVFRAFVDAQVVDLDVAIKTAAQRLRSERVAVVFSRGASADANEALLELAQAFNASRYVLEGTAAATEGVPKGDKPDPHAADEIAGPEARHAGELALHLAGGFVQTVFLLDTRVKFPEFVLGKLTELQSVCIAHAHDEVSAACQVVLPGSNQGEREGELIDSGGGTNARRPRATLVKQIVAALRELDPSSEASAPATSDGAES